MYLLWTALNGVVLIYFVASGIYALQVLWQRLGVGPLLVLLFGLYAWGTSAQQPVADAHTPPQKTSLARHAGIPTHLYVPLENHYLNSLALATTYWEQPATIGLLPSHVYLTGFRFGTTWHCELAEVTINDKLLTYEVYGTMDWRLLGVTLYQQHKHLHGQVAVR
jgi:nicotinamide riboside transporter PnuC